MKVDWIANDAGWFFVPIRFLFLLFKVAKADGS
jgi:hypothetical protein